MIRPSEHLFEPNLEVRFSSNNQSLPRQVGPFGLMSRMSESLGWEELMQNLMDLSLDSPVLVQNEFGHVDFNEIWMSNKWISINYWRKMKFRTNVLWLPSAGCLVSSWASKMEFFSKRRRWSSISCRTAWHNGSCRSTNFIRLLLQNQNENASWKNAPYEDRTHDLRIMRPTRYRLRQRSVSTAVDLWVGWW